MARCPTCYRRLSRDRSCPVDGKVSRVDGTATQASDAPQIVGYRVTKRLGTGGFADVWEGHRERDGEVVALKVALDDNALVQKRLQREAGALATIGAPHAPQYHATGHTADGRMYIAMERLEGRTLASALEQMDAPPDMPWIWRVSECLLDALSAAHERGIIHRDLKPENVFLVAESPIQLRLFDFGLTLSVNRSNDIRLTRPGTILGTAEYMAPEQLRDERDLDHRVDIYALGVMLYELFTLRPPFVGDRATIEHGHLSLRPPSPTQFSRVPAAIEDVITACLAKDPRKRPENVNAVRQALSLAWEQAASERIESSPGVPGVQTNKLSLLVDKRQPVILAAIDVEANAHEIGALVKTYGGFVARQRGTHHVCAFSGLMVDDPYESALTSAREAIQRFGARVTLHIAPLAIRRRRRRPMVIGRAVEQSMRWCPAGDWRGVLLTSALANTRPAGSTRPVPDHDGFVTPLDDPGTLHTQTELFGHEHTLRTARESIQVCLDSGTPGLFTVLGDDGLGKSRLARELAALARSMVDTARVVLVRAIKFGMDDTLLQLIDVFHTLGVAPDTTSGLSPASARHPVIAIVDDAHFCGGELLDRIEYATLDHKDVPLWVAVIANPRLEDMRGQWGARANRHERVILEPLALTAAMKLAADLLLPAEYLPAAYLQRLAEWAGGSPQLLTGLVAELKRRGIVRKRETGDSWYVSTAELERLPATPAEQWLAARIFDEMPPELASCARVCAVLGPTFTADELSSVQRMMEQHGGAGTTMDAHVGLSELVEYGLFEHSSDDRFAFKRQALQDSVYHLLAKSDREQIHQYAALYWEPRVEHSAVEQDALLGFARHAGASGRVAEAVQALISLGDTARRSHHYVEADTHYTAALRLPIELSMDRARALGGRGKVRPHINRISESFDDLREAREIYEARGETAGVVDLLLEEATTADMGGNYDISAACAERAWRELQHLDNDALKVRGLMAMGRTHWRKARVKQAIEMLREAAAAARTSGDTETEIIALLLLGPALVLDGHRQQAEDVFARVIARCTAVNDYFHECAAYGNRMFLWRNQPDRAIGDLRKAIRLARQVGNPSPERTATHNLAVLLYWSGAEDEALTLARRSRVLQQRFWKRAPHDALLLARIHAARGELASVRELLGWLKDECKLDGANSLVDIQYQMLHLIVRESTEIAHDEREKLRRMWQALGKRAVQELPAEESIEVLWWCVQQARRREHWEQARNTLSEVRSLLNDAPIWENRVNALTTTYVDVG